MVVVVAGGGSGGGSGCLPAMRGAIHSTCTGGGYLAELLLVFFFLYSMFWRIY